MVVRCHFDFHAKTQDFQIVICIVFYLEYYRQQKRFLQNAHFVASIQKYRLAKVDSKGYWDSRAFHRFSSILILALLLYVLISAITLSKIVYHFLTLVYI